MKKILLAALFAAFAAGSAGSQEERQLFDPSVVRAGVGYNLLLTPDLNEIEDIPGTDVTRGGLGFGGQALLGAMPLLPGVLWGIEVSYLRPFGTEVEAAQAESSRTSVPVLLLWEYPFGGQDQEEMTMSPLLQWGLGFSMDSDKVEIAGASDTQSSNDFALMVGPGVSYDLNENLSLAALLKYYLLFTNDVDNENTSLLNLSINLGFKI